MWNSRRQIFFSPAHVRRSCQVVEECFCNLTISRTQATVYLTFCVLILGAMSSFHQVPTMQVDFESLILISKNKKSTLAKNNTPSNQRCLFVLSFSLSFGSVTSKSAEQWLTIDMIIYARTPLQSNLYYFQSMQSEMYCVGLNFFVHTTEQPQPFQDTNE